MGFNCLMSWTDFVYLLWGPEKYGVQKRKSRKETVNTREQWMLLTDKSSSPNRKPNPGEIAPLLRELWCQCYTGGFKMFQRSFFPLPTWDISSFFGEKLYWDQRHPSPMRHTETIPWARTQVEAGTFKSRCLICETKYGAITLGQHTSRAWSAGATCHPGTCWDMLGHAGTAWPFLKSDVPDVPGSDQHIADAFLEKLPFSHSFPLQSAAVQASTKTRCAIWQADWCLGSWAFRRDRLIWPKMTLWYYILYKRGCILYTSPINMTI